MFSSSPKSFWWSSLLIRIQICRMHICTALTTSRAFPAGSVLRYLPANTGYVGSIPGSERLHEVGNGYPLQYSCLRNPRVRGDWWATVHGVAKSRTWLRGWARTHTTSNSFQLPVIIVYLQVLVHPSARKTSASSLFHPQLKCPLYSTIRQNLLLFLPWISVKFWICYIITCL